MKIDEKKPPRKFAVGKNRSVTISDCGNVHLEPNEQVTFLTEDGGEYDLARKSWGFYATPSVNGRLKNFGFKTAIVKNEAGFYYVMLVEKGKMADFEKYLGEDKQVVVEWLDEK